MTKVRNLIIVLGISILTVTIARASSTSTTSRKNKCDVNGDSKVDISDITRYNGSCRAHDSNTPERCDLNGDGNSDVSDDVAFQDKCMQIIAGFSVDDEEEEKEYDKCDLNKDSKIDNSDNVRFSNKCSSYSANGPKECDINGDGKYDISDRVKLTNCLAGTTNGNTTCKGMDKANVTHTIKDGVITLKWNEIEGDSVDISIYGDEERGYLPEGNVSMKDKKFDYKIKRSGEHKFMLRNGCNDFYYKVDVSISQAYSKELQDAYNRAYKNGIISDSNINKAELHYTLWTNLELADIMNKYAENILGLQPDTSLYCEFGELSSYIHGYDEKTLTKYEEILRKSCQYGLIPWDEIVYPTPLQEPNIEIFGTALSRALWGDKYEGGTPYYKNHVAALMTAGILDDAKTWITKGDILIMLKNSANIEIKGNSNNNQISSNNKCDLNKDNTVDISDIVRYNNKCRAHESNSPKACDLNGDGKFDVSDDITFNDKCLNGEIAGYNSEKESTNTYTGTNKCDLNKDSAVDISDIVRYNNKCRAHESNSPKACDLNGDGKFDISDDIVMENKCVGGEMAGNNKQETTETVETNKKSPDIKVLVYIKKQVNYGIVTEYTLGIDKDDKKMPVYNVGLHTSSDCSGSPVNTEPQKSIGEGGREYSDGEVIEAINTEYAQAINSISYAYDKGQYVCISKKDYPDYFKVNGDSRKVYKVNTNPEKAQNNSYTNEQNDAYDFAYENGITTVNSIDKAKMNSPLTRIAMAKMLSNYAINVLGQEPDLSKGTVKFNDVSDKLNKQYDNGVTLAYQLGIMGQNMKNNNFRPNDEVTRAEFATALSRMLYGTTDGKGNTKYYEPHLTKLYNEGIISNTNPKLKEKRGYVMTMLMRTAE